MYLYVFISICLSIYLSIYMDAYIITNFTNFDKKRVTCSNTYILSYIPTNQLPTNQYVCVCVCVCLCVCVRVCMCVRAHACVHVFESSRTARTLTKIVAHACMRVASAVVINQMAARLVSATANKTIRVLIYSLF